MHRLAILLALCSAAEVLAQIAVSEDIYKAIVRYTSFAGAAYADDCPSPPFGSSIVKFFNGTASDTQAYLFKDSTANELILAFRGTSTPTDLDTDFLFTLTKLNLQGTSCSDCKVHQGFQDSYKSIADDVTSTVNSALASNPEAKLVLTGHSLGGGLASLASSALSGQGKSVTTYTFGEPRNGNAAFSTYVNGQVKNYFRVTHANDGVPQIPPASLGFEHHGVEYWEQQSTGNSASTTVQCTGTQVCNAGADFGDNPINGAHIQYSDINLASSLNNPGCGFIQP